MRRTGFASAWPAATVLLLTAGTLRASAVSDFQARLAQTIWSAQQTESILRTLPQSATAVSTPEGLASYLALLSENVAALGAAGTARASTDEQRKAAASGLGMVATALHDQTALAGHRGLLGAAAILSELEENCRGAVTQLSAVQPAARR